MQTNQKLRILKGNLLFTSSQSEFTVCPNSYLIIDDGKVVQTCEALPKEYQNLPIEDYGDQLIIPGFVDAHLHAPQYENLGIGLDLELLPWLNTFTFPEESHFADINYAKDVYSRFVANLIHFGTTRGIIFASLHLEATQLLVDLLEEAKLCAYVGKSNMDRNCPDYLIETTQDSIDNTIAFIEKNANNERVKPIVTPRFVPSCTPELMGELGKIAKKHHLPVQSHINENKNEIAWVADLHPEFKDYADVYDHFGLFGDEKTIMAHCVFNQPRELDLMEEKQVFVAHCPTSNANLISGITAVTKMLNRNIPVGLGSDISGGHTLYIPNCIIAAMEASRLYYRYVDSDASILTFAQAFYIATKGGGAFFGKVGSFEPGYEADALVIDDDISEMGPKRSLEERLQKFIFSGDPSRIKHVYVRGEKIR